MHLCQDGISALLWSARAARLPTLALGMVLSHVAALCDHAIHARLSQISNNAPVRANADACLNAMRLI